MERHIQVSIISGSHDPNPPLTSIVCDVPDRDGSVEIPGSLITAYLNGSCIAKGMKCNRVTRYRRDVQTLNGKDVELFVGSARNLQIIPEYVY